MPAHHAHSTDLLTPLALVGRLALVVVSYLGGMGTLLASAVRSLVRPPRAAAPIVPAIARQLAWLFGAGLPMVALSHIGLGSFLTMQSYYGATFAEGTGAVVGVGLIRNITALMTGLTMAGLLAALVTPELRAGGRREFEDASRAFDLDGSGAEPESEPDPGRSTAIRIGAGLVAGPILSLWGVLVGTLVGWRVAAKLVGVSSDVFFTMFLEMIWVRDLWGLVLKGMIFGLLAALFACHEGLRPSQGRGPSATSIAACRAACLAGVAILTVNSSWFLLFYHAGPAFGPTLLAPPGR